MKGAKPLPSLAAKVFDIPQARLRQVSQLLADEYPKLVAAGVNSFAAVHHHLIEDPAIEAYLDSMSPEVVARIIRKAKAALVEGCWVTEGHVKEYLRIWMADTLRAQVFGAAEEHWRVYLRLKLQYLIPTRGSRAMIPDRQGTWSKQRLSWKVQVAIKSRDNREPAYPHPLIRHLRLKHDGLGRLSSKWTQGRASKWYRKKKKVAKRKADVVGFRSPLRMEMRLESEERDEDDIEGLRIKRGMKGLQEGEAMEDQDVREVSILLDNPHVVDMENVVKAGMASNGIIHGKPLHDRVSEASPHRTIGCPAPTTAPATPIYWSWGQDWRCGSLGVSCELDLADSRRLEQCA